MDGWMDIFCLLFFFVEREREGEIRFEHVCGLLGRGGCLSCNRYCFFSLSHCLHHYNNKKEKKNSVSGFEYEGGGGAMSG